MHRTLRLPVFLAALSLLPALPLRAAEAPPAIAIPPRLSFTAEGNVQAAFDTASPARATLRWGFARDAMTNAVSDAGGTHAHVLSFPPLPPDATVFYEAAASDGTSFANSFTAPPARSPDASFRFALHGDLEGGLEDNPGHFPYARDVSRGIVAFAPRVVVSTGDLADEAYGGFPSHPPYLAWTNFIEICSNEFSSIPFLPAIGNHDGRDPDPDKESQEYSRDQARSYFHRFFALPETAPGSVNHVARVGNATFVFLNSDADIPSQKDFLARALQSAAYDPANTFVFAIFHRPPYSTSGHGGNDEIQANWCPLFTTYETDAVFTGHVHNYQRFQPIDGVQYLVSGGAGGYPKDSVADPSLAFTTTCFHYVTATIDGATASFQACRSDHDPATNPQVFDAFTLTADRRVRVSPVFPSPGAPATVTYDPTGGPLAAASAVALHWGVDAFDSASTAVMARQSDGTFAATLSIPASATNRLAFCFKNDPDTAKATIWDNNHNRDWQALFDPLPDPPAARPVPYAPVHSPVVTDDPPGGAMNNTGPAVVDAFDFDTSFPVLPAADLPRGFGSFGPVYANIDDSTLYLGGNALDLAGTNNAAILFVGLDTLSDDAWNLWHKSSLPNALDQLHNVRFTEPMDLAIVLGDQYGDKTAYTNFTYAGHDFGQGIYYLATNSSAFLPVPTNAGARLSQFADPPATDKRPTTVWEAALPLSCLGAADNPPEHLLLCGVIVSDTTAESDRYLSRSVLADRAWSTPDAWGNTGTNTLILRPLRVALPGGHQLGDEIPNAYRVEHYGTPDAPPADADTDGDTMTTLGEYIAGTDPCNSNAFLRIRPDGTLDPPPPADRTVATEFATNLLDRPVVWTSPAPDPATVPGPLFLRARVTIP
ncbi:MAG: metallophosphoesterase [Kiritimatiellae bacterium]|nr:metallophosphoesterase [Kiritimatiellia bacterium]